MAAKVESNTRSYDLFKGVVTVILLIIIVILLLQGRAEPEVAAVPATPLPTVVEAALPVINPPTVGEEGRVSLSGSGEPGATLELWDGDASLGEVVVAADGTWSWGGTLDPGDHRLTARTVDEAGETVNESPALALTVPEPAASVPAAEAALPVINPPTVGEEGRVSLSGSGEPGATLELWDGDASLGEVVVGADGTWSWDGTLDPGDHQLTARTVDEAGETVNESPALALAVPEAAEGTVTPSEPGAGEGYIVQPGDSLAALAERFYGDWSLWRLIFQATNERAAEDPSFHVIENPRLIRPGWKLWIPAR